MENHRPTGLKVQSHQRDASHHSGPCSLPCTGGPSPLLRRAETRPAIAPPRRSTEEMMHMLKRLIRYLEATIDGVFEPRPTGRSEIEAWSDSDWAGNEERRSPRSQALGRSTRSLVESNPSCPSAHIMPRKAVRTRQCPSFFLTENNRNFEELRRSTRTAAAHCNSATAKEQDVSSTWRAAAPSKRLATAGTNPLGEVPRRTTWPIL